MKTDKEIYTLLGTDPAFLDILTAGIVIRGTYHFEAIDLKALERRCDGVLLPDDPSEPIWIIEFQAQADESIYFRLVTELGLLGQRHSGRIVRGQILFATEAIDPKTAPWHALSEQPDPPLKVAYLDQILERLELTDPDHPLLAVFLPYRIGELERLRTEGPLAYQRIRSTPMPQQAQSNCLDVFWSWLMVRFKHLSHKEIMQMFGLHTPLEETRAYQSILEEGIEKGIEKGVDQGLHREACRLVLLLLTERFGEVPGELEEAIETLPTASLESLARALLGFSSLADLTTWLAANPPPRPDPADTTPGS